MRHEMVRLQKRVKNVSKNKTWPKKLLRAAEFVIILDDFGTISSPFHITQLLDWVTFESYSYFNIGI